MQPRRALFSWKVTRFIFTVATLLVMTAILRFMISASWLFMPLLLVGLGLFALSTRGPWDSVESGRNRSVFGFRVRR